ncbi:MULTISPECIES: hypothetical protein [Stenotrophomonas]|uniref:hypothetical protein n=1 Tax=Stenotrophomonas TaxID=40323 RepID=UPI0018D2E205|nr:hypothetical protein [Stenotrophomonas sp.]MBH1506980.1 hypothetical protein [Stenotrophomonas maltophilia]
MRDALRVLTEDDYWLYGPNVHEFDEVVGLIQKYSDYADACVEQMLSGADVPPEFADAHVEVSSDLHYYNHLEKDLLWSFALWRLQGMFEAIMVVRYLSKKPGKPLFGLKAKLEAMAAEEYLTAEADVAELLAWANLRNLLSHSPPEHFHPVAVDRQDVEEYVTLLKRVCANWGSQRAGMHNVL